MNILLKRIKQESNAVIGDLSINGQHFCNSLERFELMIPAGTYKIVFNYSNRFKRMMPQIMDVPGRSGIRIHVGNFAKDSAGCILVGLHSDFGKIISSKETFQKLVSEMGKVKDITIQVIWVNDLKYPPQ